MKSTLLDTVLTGICTQIMINFSFYPVSVTTCIPSPSLFLNTLFNCWNFLIQGGYMVAVGFRISPNLLEANNREILRKITSFGQIWQKKRQSCKRPETPLLNPGSVILIPSITFDNNNNIDYKIRNYC